MRSRLFVLQLFAFEIVAAISSPASAIDCSRAAGVVETSICANNELKKSDERFNRDYSNLLDRVDARQRQELVESQKRWLVERNTQCKTKPPAEVAGCVGKAMTKREDDLVKQFSNGYNFGHLRLKEAGQTLMVGRERLDVLRPSEDVLSLVHGDTLIAETNAPFEIDGRGGDDSGEAVIISTHDYGNGGCSDQYLLSVLPNLPLRFEKLNANDCPAQSFAVKKIGNRLELSTLAEPGQDGLIRIWSPENGLVSESVTKFSPKPGTTMANLHDGDSPTDNEEFYNSLKRLASRDWRPMAQALQSTIVNIEDDEKYLVLFTCSAGVRGCPHEQAFAAYDKASKMFFFAYEPPGSRFAKDRLQRITFYPERSKWPADLKDPLETWEGLPDAQ